MPLLGEILLLRPGAGVGHLGRPPGASPWLFLFVPRKCKKKLGTWRGAGGRKKNVWVKKIDFPSLEFSRVCLILEAKCIKMFDFCSYHSYSA